MLKRIHPIVRVAVGAVLAALVIDYGLSAQRDLPMTTPESVGMSSERLARVSAAMKEHVDRNEIAGAITLIARKGKIAHFEAHGWRDKEANAPMQRDTIFTLMSMTKPIVSTALMMLLEEGKVTLEDPISRWLPQYADKMVMLENGGLVKADRPITVRHILTHTSGLSLNPPAPAGQAAPTQPRGKTLADDIDRAAPYPLLFQPGDRWQYGSSTDYVGILVEKISGQTLDEFLRTRIFEPLGMRDTFYNLPADKVRRLAAAYDFGPDGKMTLLRKPELPAPTRYFPGVAGLLGTAGDYFRFAQMLLNGGTYDGHRLLSPMTVKMMFTNQIGNMPASIKTMQWGREQTVWGGGYGFGLGGAVLTDPARAHDWLSKGTFTWSGAWGTIFWIDPSEELIPILLVQATPYGYGERIRSSYSSLASQAIVERLDDHMSTSAAR